MIKKKLTHIRDWFEDSLQSLLVRITPSGRIIIVLVIFLMFGMGSVYITVSSIYNIGKKWPATNGNRICEASGTRISAKN